MSETYQITLVFAVLSLVMVALFIKRFKPTTAFLGATLILLIAGIVPTQVLLDSVGNKSIITIFLLIFITQVLQNHFNLLGLFQSLFKNVKRPAFFTLGMSSGVAGFSALVNNTPIVALIIPFVVSWSRKRNIHPGRVLMPITFAATLGGMITLIGTSTNLVLNGLMTSNGYEPFGFFDFLVPGLLVSGVGILWMSGMASRMLKRPSNAMENLKKSTRDYIVETIVEPASPMVGRTVEQNGLRQLEGLFLVEILRRGHLIAPVQPDTVLLEEDRLYFAGDIDSVVGLVKQKPGLLLPKAQQYDLGDSLELVEALIPATSSLAGKKLRHTNFRERFDAAIVAIHRDGKRLGGKIGDQVLHYGDLLLLISGKKFQNRVMNSKDLYSLTSFHQVKKENKSPKVIFLVGTVLALGGSFAGLWSFFVSLLLISFIAVGLQLLSENDIKQEFNLDLYLILVGALVLGRALIDSGAASLLSNSLFQFLQPYGTLPVITGIFLLTLILTSFVTNVAAVAIVFPVAVGAIEQFGLAPTPVFLLVAFGASAAFLTPISYQTNLMIYGPGGYRPVDFLRFGLPITIIYSLICIAYFSRLI